MAKILVVDDNDDICKILTIFLGKYHTISIARNGKEAVEIIAQLPQDLVITDIQMPEMNGKELTKWIKANHSKIPVILMSGNLEPEGHFADYFIKKTLNLAELRVTIEMLLSRKATQRAR